MAKKLSRRDFLRLSGAATAGVMVAGVSDRMLAPLTKAMAATNAPVLPSAALQASKYKEAPMLAALVAEGKLPPVDQRLPLEPKVRNMPSIGKYSGIINEQTGGQGGHFFFDGAMLTFPQETNNQGNIIEPDLCWKVENSADMKEFTFYFREGQKWSDGAPFTVDDIIWWWENEQLNTDLYPEGPLSSWVFGDQYVVFEKIDDFTIKVKTPVPYRPMLNMSAHETMMPGSTWGQPSQFMQQFHIAFNPDAEKLAKDNGFDFWYQAYNRFTYYLRPLAGKPLLGPWWKIESTTTYELFERNPYFFEVDAEGQQLPYLDQVYLEINSDASLREANVLAGEMTQADLRLSQIDVARGNQENGDYHILSWAKSNPTEAVLAFNLNHKDPAKREVYNDRRFRMAMSYAINRQEINDTLYFGLARTDQATINYNATYFKEEWLTKYAEFNVDMANSLLDEMGLAWDGDKKWRLLPNGERLTSIYLFYPEFQVEILELVRRQWEAVGHELIIQEVDRALRDERCLVSDHDVTGWNTDLMEEIACYLPWRTKFQPNLEMYYGVQWWTWYTTGGAQGEEPPQAWKDQFDRMAAWYAATSDEEYTRLAQEVWQFFSDEIPLIGTIGYAPMPTVTKNGLQNVPEYAVKGYGTLHAKSFFVQTYYWDNPEAHQA